MASKTKLKYDQATHEITDSTGKTCMNFKSYLEGRSRESLLEILGRVQISLYIMCGGGYLGHSAVEQPKDFYVDTRASVPYKPSDITRAITFYRAFLTELGFSDDNIPSMPHTPHLCVF